jgi:hypothetical protein
MCVLFIQRPFQSNHPAWWNRMLPRSSRCILGLEGEPQQQMRAGERDAENQAQRRQRRRFSAMWAGAEPLFDRFLPVEPSPAAAVAAPQSQRNFAPASCVDLLRSLSADPQSSRVERRLRDSTLVLISTYLEQDQAVARTVPRNVQRRARVAPPTVVASDDPDASSSDDSDDSSSDDSDDSFSNSFHN